MVTAPSPVLAFPVHEVADGRYCRTEDVEFPCRDPDEQFRFSFHQHWMRLVWPVTKMLLLTSLIAIIGGLTFFSVVGVTGTTRHLILIFLLAFFLAVQFEFLVRLYRYFLYLIVVTDRRVHRIKKTLLLVDEHETIDLWVLQEIQKMQHGPIQNVFGFGSVTFEAQDTRLTIHFVPRISERYREIMHLRELARASARKMQSA